MGPDLTTDSGRPPEYAEDGKNNEDHPPAILSEDITVSPKSIENIDDNDHDDDELLSSAEQNEKMTSTDLFLKAVVGLLLVGFVFFVVADTATSGYVKDVINSFLEWVEDNPVGGVFLFIVVYAVASVLFIPGSVLTLGAGFIFAMDFGFGPGIVLGSVSVFVGASLGAVASFLLGRYLLRDQVARLTARYAVFEAIDSALQDNGLRIFFLLRLSPVMPFNVINYAMGITSVSLRDYTLALVAIVPGVVLFVFLGASAGCLAAGAGQEPVAIIVVIVAGTLFGVAAVWMTSRYARRELRRILERRQPTRNCDTEEDDGDNDNHDDEEGQVQRDSDGIPLD